MSVVSKTFAYDSRDPLALIINQDPTGLTVSLRSKNLHTGVVRSGTIAGFDTLGGGEFRIYRDWLADEKPQAGGVLAVEADLDWPDEGGARTHPDANEPAVLVQVEPRRTEGTPAA